MKSDPGHRRCTDPNVNQCVRCALPWPCPKAVAKAVDNCASYNWQVGEVPQVALNAPNWLDRRNLSPYVMIDACIAAVVQALWDAGHRTLGSCCGHGKHETPRPSLVLDNGEQDFDGIRTVIASVDDRSFELLQWRLCEVDAPKPASVGGRP